LALILLDLHFVFLAWLAFSDTAATEQFFFFFGNFHWENKEKQTTLRGEQLNAGFI